MRARAREKAQTRRRVRRGEGASSDNMSECLSTTFCSKLPYACVCRDFGAPTPQVPPRKSCLLSSTSRPTRRTTEGVMRFCPLWWGLTIWCAF